MNIKNINKFFLLFILIFVLSCKSLEQNIKTDNKILSKEDILIEKLKNKKEHIDYDINNYDLYQNSNSYNWKLNHKINKLYKFNNFSLDDSYNYLNSYIIDNIIYNISDKITFDSYNLDSEKRINRFNIFDDFVNVFTYPTSFIFLNGFFYVGFSDATIIKFDVDGYIHWSISFNDILKTPLKIQSQNIIVMLSNKILSIDHITGNTNWQFEYNNKNSIHSDGGYSILVNNIFYFILPNKSIGQIDTLIGKKVDSFFSNMKIDNGLWKLDNSLHFNKNQIFLIENNKYITAIDIYNQKLHYNKEIILYSKSYFLIENSLLVLTDNNYLQSYNLENMNLFWEIKLSKKIKKDDKMINIIKKNDTYIIFMSSGLLFEIDIKSGKINITQKIKLSDINGVYFNQNYIFINQKNGDLTIYNQ